ncbi:MAG: AAA family ATPase [Saprospiraceae bacterium]|nr:AAA family ATPase [Saprospiraceae bacterium]
MIIAITGASGVGKTTILKELSKIVSDNESVKVFHFDDMELPNWDELEDAKKWQQDATIEWIDTLVNIARNDNAHILFEGSTEIKFYQEGFNKNSYQDYSILLFDCSEETMKHRLIERGQPELFHSNMVGWLSYLRREAKRTNVEIIKTDRSTIPEIVQVLIEKLHLK